MAKMTSGLTAKFVLGGAARITSFCCLASMMAFPQPFGAAPQPAAKKIVQGAIAPMGDEANPRNPRNVSFQVMGHRNMLEQSVRSTPARSTPAPATPEIVTLDGILNADSDSAPVFTSDGGTVFFDRSAGVRKSVVFSRHVHGRWAAPRVAPFSGHYFDQDPVVSRDGSFLIFASDRPVPARTTRLCSLFSASRARAAIYGRSA
jgi:hypothetical protein